jgi:type I restriction enzyme, S subunit
MVTRNFSRFGKVDAEWPNIRLRDVIVERVKWVLIEDKKQYSRVTARVRNQGIEVRDTVFGHVIKTKRQKLCKANDLLVAEIDAKVGGFGIVPSSADGAIVSSHYFLFEIDSSKVCVDWLDKVVRDGRLQRQVDAVGSTNYAAIRPRDVGAFQMPLPPLAEQQAIASVLISLEGAIASSQALILQLANTKLATMRELLTFGMQRKKAKLVPLPEKWILGRVAEGVTHIPANWNLVRLVNVAKLQSGHTPDRKEQDYWQGKIPWISLQDAIALRRLEISETAETIGPAGLKNSSARMLPAGTVVLQRTANVGLASIMGREMCTSQHFINWICGEQLIPTYLLQVFRHMAREWQRLVAGSVLPDIYMDTFKVLQILLPPLEEQKQIAEFGCSFDRKIELEEEALTSLYATRDALAQELLSGRLRLPQSIIARFENKTGKAA